MKKKVLCLCVLLCAVLAVAWYTRTKPALQEMTDNAASTEQTVPPVGASEEVRAVWVNYNELSMKALGGGTQAQFSEKADAMVKNIREAGLNTVIVHVRPFCDAFYPSAYFPWTSYLTGTQGKSVEYDPLKVFITCAKAQGLSVQAWINPYRVLLSQDMEKLADNNPAKRWAQGEKRENLLFCEAGIFLNPASVEAQALILNGVRELVQNYAIDAIHMDDYFYPTTEASVDQAQYAAYCAAGGALSLADWRRENVSTFVSGLYATVKAVNPAVQVVISPGGDLQRNYETLYADIARWAKEPGFVDVLMPQLYYGFDNAKKPFESTAREWAQLSYAPSVQLCFGLAAYKCGQEDAYAGSGKTEWQTHEDILMRQLKICRTLPHYKGFALYTYSSIFHDNLQEIAKKEWRNLKNMLQ